MDVSRAESTQRFGERLLERGELPGGDGLHAQVRSFRDAVQPIGGSQAADRVLGGPVIVGRIEHQNACRSGAREHRAHLLIVRLARPVGNPVRHAPLDGAQAQFSHNVHVW